MPRSLVLGNGNVLIGFDRYGRVRDFHFPHVGLENHTADCIHRIGIWVDGVFSWVGEGWDVRTNYDGETLVSRTDAENRELNVILHFRDTVYNEDNVFIRRITLENRWNRKRSIRIFFNQQFEISGLNHGNTAYYDPDLTSIVHYRGRRIFLVTGAHLDGKSFDDYSIGGFNIEGKEGTWRDAEDGVLSKNAVEHGSVDSTIGFHHDIPAMGSSTFDYIVIAAKDLHEMKTLWKEIKLKTPNHMVETTANYWKAWVNKNQVNLIDIDTRLEDLFKKSLLIIRTHVDNDGAIIASGDSDILQYGRDTYNYMWPRDGALTAIALDRMGYIEVTNRFFEFCNKVLSEEGYLHHKYQSDGSLGSSWHPWIYNDKKQLAIQEDETALVLHALWNHYAFYHNLEFIEKIYNPFVKKIADFLYFYRDEKTGLPYGSYDLWEEKFGTSTFTAATVYAALRAAGNFADVLGKKEESEKYEEGARELKEGILTHLYDEKLGCFVKLIDTRDGDTHVDRTIDVSNFYGPYRFGVLPKDDERIKKSFETVMSKLSFRATGDHSHIGGVARHENDPYHRKDAHIPGNPWFLTTLWLYQYRIAVAETQKDLEAVRDELKWVCDRALPSGIMSEQLDPHTGEQISVAPLTWSHAEFINTILDYLDKAKCIR